MIREKYSAYNGDLESTKLYFGGNYYERTGKSCRNYC